MCCRSFNIEIHGMRPADTSDASDFKHVWPEVADLIGSRLVNARNTAERGAYCCLCR